MIPLTFHFIFGLQPDFGGKPFSLIHYMAAEYIMDLRVRKRNAS